LPAQPYLLLLNPADIFRILNVFSLDDVQRLYGLASILPPALSQVGWLASAMLAWIVAPLALASWRFRP
jgi:Cu-processing system permease protein